MYKNRKRAISALAKIDYKNSKLTKVYAQGISMCPTLIQGDILQIEPANKYLEGEIVVFFNKAGRNLIAHRILSENDGTYITKGDNAITNEEVVFEDILGRVKKIQRGEEIYDINDLLLCSARDIVERSKKVLDEYNLLQSITLVQKSISYNQLHMYLYRNICLNKNKYSIYSQYFELFSCKRERCINNCCKRGYIIYIDKAAYERYMQVCSELEKYEFMHNTYLLPAGEATVKKYAIIDGREGICPYLSDNGLCMIHRKYGHTLVGNVCRDYPHIIRQFEGYELKALQMTCEAAVEMMFSHISPIEFMIRATGGNLTQNSYEFVDLRRLLAYACVIQFRVLPIYKRLSALAWFGRNENGRKQYQIDYRYFESEEILYASKEWLLEGNDEIKYVFEIESLYSSLFLILSQKIMKTNVHSNTVIKLMEKETKKRICKIWTYIIDKYEYAIENYMINDLMAHYPDCGDNQMIYTRMLCLYLLIQAVTCIKFKTRDEVTQTKLIEVLCFVTNDFVNNDFIKMYMEMVAK